MRNEIIIPVDDNLETLAEIDIRGRFMMMACDIEWSMLYILMYSTNDPHNHHRVNKFNGMMMHEKIQTTICDLKKYHPNYYQEYIVELEQLMEFKEVRNDMGHYRMEFEKDLQSFKMPYVGIENGVERVLYKSYTLQQMVDIILKFQKANMRFVELILKLKKDFNKT
jgi:hypothetical protein